MSHHEMSKIKLSASITVGLTPKVLPTPETEHVGYHLKADAGNGGDVLVGNKYDQKYPLDAGQELALEAEEVWVVGSAGADEVQTLSITGSPTGGSFTITFNGETTAAIAFNATANDVETALEALNGIDDVVVTGGPLPGTAIVITFAGSLSGVNVALMTTTDSLTGGTAPASSIVETTPGSGQVLAYLVL